MKGQTAIGIAMATCNGAPHLDEQLASLGRQRLRPDHLVVCDDASTDATRAMIEAFAKTAPFTVELLTNTARLGPMQTFLRAADASPTRWIAFCDQDDVWRPEKLQRVARTIQRDDALLIVHALDHFRQTAGGPQRVARTVLPGSTVDGLRIPPHKVTRGMSMVVRKDVLSFGRQLRDEWSRQQASRLRTRPLTLSDRWSEAHDMYALTTARLWGRVTLLSEVLADQRWHESNFSAAGSGWTQDPVVARSWGDEAGAGHRIMSHFCAEFAALVADAANDAAPPADRRRQIVESYRRWSQIWDARARLAAVETPMTGRIAELARIARKAGYMGPYSGGLGLRGLARDATSVLGLASRSGSRS